MRRHFARLLGLAATSSLAILWLIAAPTASAGDPCYHDFEHPGDQHAEAVDRDQDGAVCLRADHRAVSRSDRRSRSSTVRTSSTS